MQIFNTRNFLLYFTSLNDDDLLVSTSPLHKLPFVILKMDAIRVQVLSQIR